jgi:hypothetical protein
MVASQHPCALDCSLWSHPFRIGRTQSPAQQFLLLGFFITRLLIQASLIRSLAIKKPALFVRAL